MRQIRYMAASLFLLWIAVGTIGAVHAQDDGYADLYRSWLEGQRSSFIAIGTFTIHADILHVVSTGSGERTAEIGLDFLKGRDAASSGASISFFQMNGDTLDVSERRRIQRSLSSITTPELGPLLTGVAFPTQLLRRARMSERPTTETVDGRTLVLFELSVPPPDFRDDRSQGQGNPGIRPPGGQGPGRQPGLQPGRGGRPANGRRPPQGGRRPGVADMEVLPHTVLLWLDATSGALIQSQLHLTLPGGRGLVSETQYERIQGLDVPATRWITGTFPLQRRLRTVTVSLEHTTVFSGFAASID